MSSSKPRPADGSSNRRAQPARNTRNNPPRSAVPGSRQFGSRASLGGNDGRPPSPEQPVAIFPAITQLADIHAALPKEFSRQSTLLKEVDAKICGPEQELGRLVDMATNAPISQPTQPFADVQHASSAHTPMSAHGSVNESAGNSHAGPASFGHNATQSAVLVTSPTHPSQTPRRQLFKHLNFTLQSMLTSLDEKNHVLSTTHEVIKRHTDRIDDVMPHVMEEFSQEAIYGSNNHWAYAENRENRENRSNNKSGPGPSSRRDLAAVNQISAAAAAQHMQEDKAAQRSDTRKQALLAKKNKAHPAESDFDDHNDSRQKDKRNPGNSKGKKTADSPMGIGLGISNGVATNGTVAKRRKLEKGPAGGSGMERGPSAMGNNSALAKKVASPRDAPVVPSVETAKKPSRKPAAAATNGAGGRQRKNTITSMTAMSPSLASSPVRNTFPDAKLTQRPSSPPTNGRPATARGRQNSTQSTLDNAKPRPASVTSNKTNGNGASTPPILPPTAIIGRSILEVKTSTKEPSNLSKTDDIVEAKEESHSTLPGSALGRTSKEGSLKREDSVPNAGDAMQTTVIMTKSGRASKPSTPAIPHFPAEPPVRSRSARNAIETISSNKRSHKKGAGAAAQQLRLQQGLEEDEASSIQGDDEEEEGGNPDDPDEPRYCYCNGVSYGEMVGCDSQTCVREWFHLECVGLKVAPKQNVKWFCDDCKEKVKTKRFNGR